MMSHRILITVHFFSAFLFGYALQVLGNYFMQIFVNPVERLNSAVYSAPPCTIANYQRSVMNIYQQQ